MSFLNLWTVSQNSKLILQLGITFRTLLKSSWTGLFENVITFYSRWLLLQMMEGLIWIIHFFLGHTLDVFEKHFVIFAVVVKLTKWLDFLVIRWKTVLFDKIQGQLNLYFWILLTLKTLYFQSRKRKLQTSVTIKTFK